MSDWILSFSVNSIIIHPIWVIDEYAIMARRNDWFIPSIPPISAFKIATNINTLVEIFVRINIITIKGANFCQVESINAGHQEIDIITEGYQEWQGAIPVLIIIDKSTSV